MPKFTFLWCLSVVASLNYFSQYSHKSKSSVNWHLMVSQFTWNIKTFVTLITIKINCENCDTRFNDSGKLRYHKVPLHGFSCNNCYKRFNEGLCSWRMVDKKEYQIIITLLFCTVKDRLCLQYLNLSTITFFHTILQSGWQSFFLHSPHYTTPTSCTLLLSL